VSCTRNQSMVSLENLPISLKLRKIDILEHSDGH